MTSHDVTIKAGISYRQLDYWCRAGLVPNIDRLVAVGSGVPREWRTDEAHFVMRLARLARAGLNVRTASAALQAQTVGGVLPDRIDLGRGVAVHLDRASALTSVSA